MLTIACFVDRYAEAVTCLPRVFQIWILQDGTDDCFAPDAHSGRFAVPPKELPTIRSLLPLSKPQISPRAYVVVSVEQIHLTELRSLGELRSSNSDLRLVR